MAFTLTQLEALEKAISSGRLEVRYDGRLVRYQTVADLKVAYDLVKTELTASGQLAAPAGSNRGPSSLAVFSRD